MRREIVERVPGFVHEGVHVVRHTDGVHEDERHAAPRELRAITAGRLPWPALQIEQSFVGHPVELRAELGIERGEDAPSRFDESFHIRKWLERTRTLELHLRIP